MMQSNVERVYGMALTLDDLSRHLDDIYVAGEDLSSSQYCIVIFKTHVGHVGLPIAPGEASAGVLQNNPKRNGRAVVRLHGKSRIKLASMVAMGDPLSIANISGKAGQQDGNSICIGVARQAGNAGEEIDCNVVMHGKEEKHA